MKPEESTMTDKKARDAEVAQARRYMAMSLTKNAMDRARGHWVPWLIEALDEAEAERDALKAKLAALESSLAEMAVKLDEGIECYPSSPCNIFATLLELQGLWRGKPSAKVQP